MTHRRATPRSRAAWRRWLERNHDSAADVWLVFYKKHTGKPTLTYNDAVEEALCFGWIDGIRKSVDEERYMHRFSPRLPGSRWSESNRRRVARLAAEGLMTPAGTRLVEAARRNGNWDGDGRPEVDLSMPAELQKALKGTREAARFFASLAPSYQRQYIAWIVTAKREETRSRRIAESIRLLARGEKLGMR